MRLQIYQVGEAMLRQQARPLTAEDIRSASIQQLIELMRETLRDVSGVGLAAPQVGQALQLAVIEDREEYTQGVSAEILAERERSPVPFHVIINPRLSMTSDPSVAFFEACLSTAGFGALVSRALAVRVECLDHRAEPVVIDASGWYARILQHEIDHLHGTLYTDRMEAWSLMTVANYKRYWRDKSTEEIRAAFELPPRVHEERNNCGD